MAGQKEDPSTVSPAVLTVDEIAALLRVNKTTIYRLLKAGKLPSFRVGSEHRFDRQAIDEWCQTQEAKQQAPAHQAPAHQRGPKARNG